MDFIRRSDSKTHRLDSCENINMETSDDLHDCKCSAMIDTRKDMGVLEATDVERNVVMDQT